MAELFSDAWMKGYQAVWNSEPDVCEALAKINFNSIIGVGFPDEDKPRGVFVVEVGKAVRAGTYGGETLNWDMRAKQDDWLKWQEKGIGMTGLGMAAATGKLKFRVGDYAAMFKNPAMAGPFVKSFSLMGKVK